MVIKAKSQLVMLTTVSVLQIAWRKIWWRVMRKLKQSKSICIVSKYRNMTMNHYSESSSFSSNIHIIQQIASDGKYIFIFLCRAKSRERERVVLWVPIDISRDNPNILKKRVASISISRVTHPTDNSLRGCLRASAMIIIIKVNFVFMSLMSWCW